MGDVEQLRSMPSIQDHLNDALEYLLDELEDAETYDLDHFRAHDDYVKLSFLRRLLCVRPAQPSLPTDVAATINSILQYELERRPHVDVAKLDYIKVRHRSEEDNPSPQIAIWKGDIRDLHGATAIVNAANSQLLGCFQPNHACIDNAVHASAGPQLRQACFELMSKQGKLEPEGQAKVTPGFNLLAKYVIHTVGPELRDGRQPTSRDRALLESCYVECLRAVEDLPRDDAGHKSIAFCSISTGLFGFPIQEASQIAGETVLQYFKEHQQSSITHVVFDVFSDKDLVIYQHALQMSDLHHESQPRTLQDPLMPNARLALARKLWNEADFVIISAGAGLSANAGLDYTSRDVFCQHLPDSSSTVSAVYMTCSVTTTGPLHALAGATLSAIFAWYATTLAHQCTKNYGDFSSPHDLQTHITTMTWEPSQIATSSAPPMQTASSLRTTFQRTISPRHKANTRTSNA
jgi:O-acetyl-ADP-ribose deacetylase (regulator of RNase III)